MPPSDFPLKICRSLQQPPKSSRQHVFKRFFAQNAHLAVLPEPITTPRTFVCFGPCDNALPPCLLLTKEPPKVVSWPQNGGSMHLQPILAMHTPPHPTYRNCRIFLASPQVTTASCRHIGRIIQFSAPLHRSGADSHIATKHITIALDVPVESLTRGFHEPQHCHPFCVCTTRAWSTVAMSTRHVNPTPSSLDCHVSPSPSPWLLENIYIWIQDFQPSSTG
jgi:hypothetical protein